MGLAYRSQRKNRTAKAQSTNRIACQHQQVDAAGPVTGDRVLHSRRGRAERRVVAHIPQPSAHLSLRHPQPCEGVELVREARELIAHASDPGTVVPRLLDKPERSLRLVSEPQGSRLITVEELTAREAAVLRLLPTGLSAREIGQELGVSRNTVKTDSKNLYRKLGATGRREAVSRGRELGLL